jgi:hypothetical protein
VLADASECAVVHARSPQLAVAQLESEGVDQMQLRPDIRRQPDDVTGVRRDFRLDEYDVEHVRARRRNP